MKAEIVFRPGARRIGYSVEMGAPLVTAKRLVATGKRMLQAFAEAVPFTLEVDVEFREALARAMGSFYYNPEPTAYDGVPIVMKA